MKKTLTVHLRTLFLGFLIFFAGTMLFCQNAHAADKKVYGLVISAYSDCENDSELMYDRLVTSNLEGYSTSTSVTKFSYDQESGSGITVAKMGNLITSSMNNSTSKDVYFFYYSGHSVTDGNGNSIGISLRGNNGVSSLQYTWKALASSLSAFPGKVVVILDTCHAECFYTEGVASLSSSKQSKFYCLLSCGADEKSYVSIGVKKYSEFTKTIGEGLGYFDGNVAADANSNGVVTLKELYKYTKNNIMYSSMTVKKYGADSIKLFGYSVSLNNTSLTLYVGQTKKMKAYVTGCEVSGTWSSSDKSVVKVSSSGKLTAKKAGTATITVTYNGTSAKCKVTVKDPSITLNKSSVSLLVGDTVKLKATVEGESDTVTWTSSKTSVAKANSNGKVTAKKAGTATITATANGVSVTCKVTVLDSAASMSTGKVTITLSPTYRAIKVGAKYTITAKVTGTSSAVTWTSANKKVARVSSKGVVTGVSEGSTTITAKVDGKTATFKVRVCTSGLVAHALNDSGGW